MTDDTTYDDIIIDYPSPKPCGHRIGEHKCCLYDCPSDDPEWVHQCGWNDCDWTAEEHVKLRLGKITELEVIQAGRERAVERCGGPYSTTGWTNWEFGTSIRDGQVWQVYFGNEVDRDPPASVLVEYTKAKYLEAGFSLSDQAIKSIKIGEE